MVAISHLLAHLWDVRFKSPPRFSGVPLKILSLIAKGPGGFRRHNVAREFGSGPLGSSLLQSRLPLLIAHI